MDLELELLLSGSVGIVTVVIVVTTRVPGQTE